MQTLGKLFHINVENTGGNGNKDSSTAGKMNIQLNTDYIEKNKKLNDLKEKVEAYENENKNILKQYQEKENQYLEKIKVLEKQLLISDKVDIVMIQKQNKEYEMQIANLNKTVISLESKHLEENNKFKSMIGEIMILKDQLNEELSALDSLKKEILERKSKNGDSNHNKVHLVMKYNNQQIEGNDQSEVDLKQEYNSHYQVRRTTRTEFDQHK